MNENLMREGLLRLAERGKTDYVMISSILAELAALRETVRGLDPTFSEVLEERRREFADNQREEVKETIRLCNDLIEKLKAL